MANNARAIIFFIGAGIWVKEAQRNTYKKKSGNVARVFIKINVQLH